MISFVSTFPPIICGIGTYTKYVVEHLPRDRFGVLSFDLNQFDLSGETLKEELRERVDYCLSFPSPTLPPLSSEDLIWFQHAFGMWGDINDHFLGLLRQARRRGNRVVVSLHTVHFQSNETPCGLCKIEEDLLRETLPLVDALTLFTDGAYRAASGAFPEYRDRILVLRHGVHLYPPLDKNRARERFFSFLSDEADIPGSQRKELRRLRKEGLFSDDVIFLGNYGFITTDKDPMALYKLGRMVQSRLPDHRVITIYAGIVQRNRDNTLSKKRPVLEALRRVHDGERNFFFEIFMPEEIFPIALRALDFAVFWCSNATQSGRMAHAQGTGVIIAGRDCEGVGETLRLSGVPAATSLEDLAEKIAVMALEPGLRREVERRSQDYARIYCFANQARKHILIEEALSMGGPLPLLDRGEAFHVHDRAPGFKEASAHRSKRFGEAQRMAA